MQAQIACPNCGTQYAVEVHQLVDAQRTPQLKQQLLNGTLNAAVCPQCGMGGPLTTLLAYHDAKHDLFMIYVPQELNMTQVQRETAVSGQLTRQVMESVPQEQRRAYLFQPQMMLTMQSFMENVLETEGITKEMIARQQKQAELLRTLASADKDVQSYLLKERGKEIDETFFAMLQSFIDQVAQMNDEAQLVKLTNLRAKLMTETAVGKQVEKQQIAMHKLNQEAKKAGGLTFEMFLKHLIANIDDEKVVDALAAAGAGALQYQFFGMLSDKISEAEEAGNKDLAQKLTALREKLLGMYESMQNAQKEVMQQSMNTIDQLLKAPNQEEAFMEELMQGNIDEAFMAVLMARLSEAEQKGNQEEAEDLMAIYQMIQQQMENQLPPEIAFLNQLVQTEDTEMQRQILQANQDLLSPELVELIDQVIEQSSERGETELNGRLQAIKSQIQAALLKS